MQTKQSSWKETEVAARCSQREVMIAGISPLKQTSSLTARVAGQGSQIHNKCLISRDVYKKD